MAADKILHQWARLGILFNVRPSGKTPDIEKLLVDTAIMLPYMPRLLPASVTWLTCYERLVCRHRLAGLAAVISDVDTAAMGLLLSIAKDFSGTDHFNLVIKKCRPLKKPKPLFEVDRKARQLWRLSQTNSSPISRKWGLWCEPVKLKENAVRPLTWVMQHNPSLQQRAVFSGNLRASILETLAHDKQAGQSESLLARHCHATRKAVREALDHLEFCQLIVRRNSIGKTLIKRC
jgi:hypothetical protein